ncbi:hypothetical protein C0Q70_04524 [Pomacea canaliculata]|uniref:Uncharacterized protein n=2 Tax=Pomacea canaliculata TaxID=400727 RepID=A0A2T7PIL9_POMCA|nr:hypothetical protein C0Q70_04524 [Pomacea canaliculata]
MPLSGSHWAPPLADFMLPQGHQPKRLNEVNPVKRKMTWDTQLQACNGEQMLTESMEHIAKRQCKDNHFAKNIFPSSAYQPHEQMEVPSLYGCLKYTTAPLEQSDSQSEISSKSQLLPFENNLLMDLSDETYSSSKHDEELDSVHSAMESDSLPESQQHRNIGYCSTPCP